MGHDSENNIVFKENFTEEETPRIIDSIYYDCNFSSKMPDEIDEKKVGKRIFPGDDTPRLFISCNLSNRIVPPGSTWIDCNRAVAEVGVEVQRTKTGEIEVNGTTLEVFDLVLEHRIYGNYDKSDKLNYKLEPIIKQYDTTDKKEKIIEVVK